MKRSVQKSQVKRLLFTTYLAVIKNSQGSQSWKNFYALVDGQQKEIMAKGDLSCAFFVSSILKIFSLVKDIHGTVEGTIKDLEQSGFHKVRKPQAGDILIWESSEKFDNHTHIGFYIGQFQAVSNSSSQGSPQRHHWTYKGKRKITAIYRQDKLSATRQTMPD